MTDEWEQVKDDAKEQDPNFFWNPGKNPEQPRTIEGEVVKIGPGKFGIVATIETKEGLRQTSGQKGLSPKVEKLSVGQYVKVTWTGQKSMANGKKDMFTYDVAIKKNYTPKPRVPEAPKDEAGDIIIKAIIDELKYAQGFFNGAIPEQNALQCIKKHMMGVNAGKEAEFLATLKQKGMLAQNKDGYLVV